MASDTTDYQSSIFDNSRSHYFVQCTSNAHMPLISSRGKTVPSIIINNNRAYLYGNRYLKVYIYGTGTSWTWRNTYISDSETSIPCCKGVSHPQRSPPLTTRASGLQSAQVTSPFCRQKPGSPAHFLSRFNLLHDWPSVTTSTNFLLSIQAWIYLSCGPTQ